MKTVIYAVLALILGFVIGFMLALPRDGQGGVYEPVTQYAPAVVINDDGSPDSDSRFEGDTQPNLLLVDVSADRVGIGTSTPSRLFSVGDGSGTTSIDFGKVCFTLKSSTGTPFYAYFNAFGSLATSSTSCH